MFDLTRPCRNCPFRKSDGWMFGLSSERLQEIFTAEAFQCHKTVDYSDDEEPCQGTNPQQCAGLIALQHKQGNPNTITQVAMRITGYKPENVDGTEVYDSYGECIDAHAIEPK